MSSTLKHKRREEMRRLFSLCNPFFDQLLKHDKDKKKSFSETFRKIKNYRSMFIFIPFRISWMEYRERETDTVFTVMFISKM
jgi:hypothetical protein